MSIQVTGVLRTPLNDPIANSVIRIEALNTDSVLVTAVGSAITDDTGNYDFTLLDGTYQIEVLRTDEYKVAGNVLVDAGVPASIDLPTLLNDHAVGDA